MPIMTAALLLGQANGAAAQMHVASETPTVAHVLFERAEELHRAHRLDDALDLYEDAVGAMDDAGELPLVPLQRIATIHLASRDPGRAAEAMDRLAARAEWLGVPEVQAKALLEAAVLYQQAGVRNAVWERVRRLEPLLGSPHLDPVTLARIRARLQPGPVASR